MLIFFFAGTLSIHFFLFFMREGDDVWVCIRDGGILVVCIGGRGKVGV